MSSTQVFIWKKESILATLEVRHQKFEMLLNTTAEFVNEIRAKMSELNNCGMYPNEEVPAGGNLATQFIISGEYNWNTRWRDFRTILDNFLGMSSVERPPK